MALVFIFPRWKTSVSEDPFPKFDLKFTSSYLPFSLVLWCSHKDFSIHSKRINISPFAADLKKASFPKLIMAVLSTNRDPYIKPFSFLETMRVEEWVCDVAIENGEGCDEESGNRSWVKVKNNFCYWTPCYPLVAWMLLFRGKKYVVTVKHGEDNRWYMEVLCMNINMIENITSPHSIFPFLPPFLLKLISFQVYFQTTVEKTY